MSERLYLSRREFFHLVHGIGCGVISAGLLAACAPAVRENTNTTPSGPVGKLTVALSSLGTAQVYLPWREAGAEGWIVMWGFYEGLTSVSPITQKLEPMLAERWEVQDDGKRWTFFLRRGVPFQDGWGELTAEDVRFTFDQIMSEKSIHTGKGSLGQVLERVEVDNPYQVTFYLKRTYPFFADLIAQNYYFGIVSRKYVESVGEEQAAAKPVGTGPFKLIEHQRLHFARFEAVENHWRITPQFKTLELRQIQDPSARLDMLRAGQADVAEIPFKLKREAEAAGMRFTKSESAALYHVHLGGQVLPSRNVFDPTVPWVGDPNDPVSQERALKVRKALALAVDKQAIIDSVFYGEAKPLTYPFYSPHLEYLPKLPPYPYNPEEARRLLAEAGYTNGFSREIEMLLQPWPGRAEMVDVDEAVAGFWEKHLGLRVKRTPMDFATWAPIGRARDMAWRTWTQGVQSQPANEPAIPMVSWITSTSTYNTVAERPDIDELYARITSTIDQTKREELHAELARKLYEGYYCIPIAAVPSLYAINPKTVSNWPRAPGESYLRGYEYIRRAE